jgi:hypothetical protein
MKIQGIIGVALLCTVWPAAEAESWGSPGRGPGDWPVCVGTEVKGALSCASADVRQCGQQYVIVPGDGSFQCGPPAKGKSTCSTRGPCYFPVRRPPGSNAD